MRASSTEVSLYVDTLIVQTLLTDDVLSKRAQAGGFVSELIEKFKNYISNQIRPDDKIGSLLNIIGPGVIAGTLSALGMPFLGTFIGFALRFFHIDLIQIVRSIWDKLKSLISGDQKTTSEHVDAIVDASVQGHVGPASAQEAEQSFQSADMNKASSRLLREARFCKLAMIDYQVMVKTAGPPSSMLSWFGDKKAASTSLLSIVLKWIFKIALVSAGLMVAGDVANKFFGRPNALDGSVSGGRVVQQPTSEPAVPVVVSKQTKFKVNPGFHDVSYGSSSTWTENVRNSPEAISDMVLGWAKQVYQGLDNLDNIIRNTAGFQAVVEAIEFHNNRSRGASIIFMPNFFTSKKMVVDHFIDEVAEKAR